MTRPKPVRPEGCARVAGADSEGHTERQGERRCVATRRALTPEEGLRFVAGPDGALVADIRRKLPGRGVWTELSRAAVEEAVRAKAFARSLKTQVTVSGGLADEVDALLARDALQSLSIANKAGLVVTGFGKVEALAESRAVAAVVTAADAADDGRRKIAAALRRGHGEAGGGIALVDCFGSRDLSLALGRELVIHAAARHGAAVGAFLGRWRRLMHFRTGMAPAALTEDS
jgi:uncharacterized protein